MPWYHKFWPFRKQRSAEEADSNNEFKKLIAESRARTDDLEAVAERLKINRENIHKRAQQLLGEGHVRPAFKSSP